MNQVATEPRAGTRRVVLNAAHFRALVAGETVRLVDWRNVPVEIALADIGFARMLDLVNEAEFEVAGQRWTLAPAAEETVKFGERNRARNAATRNLDDDPPRPAA